jgi:polysaccharide export outer membrane protein
MMQLLNGMMLRLVPAFALAVLLAACGHERAEIPYDPTGFVAPDTQLVSSQDDAYRIGPSDIISIQVFNVPEVSGDYTVLANGQISMPLVGEIDAQQKTTREFELVLEQRLGAKYYEKPDVTVAIKEARSRRITVDGAVSAPGIYPVPSKMTLLQAVALAKGVSEEANTGRIVIFRSIEGRRAAAAFDLNKIREGQMRDPEVFGNDLIVVDSRRGNFELRDVVRAVPVLALFRVL